MQHFGLTLELKDDPELIAQYKAYHADPWPEPLQGLGKVGITDMKIFLLGQRMFMYMTTTDEFDPARDFPRYVEQNPKAKEWDELMRTFQQQVPEAKEGEWWANMELVFDLQLHV
ncbi:MAG: L-rhamnose mutarotase [Gemmatimonadota bacterium]|nr:L-rhamnose mutarotase [Gemmatimonadota bacterium]